VYISGGGVIATLMVVPVGRRRRPRRVSASHRSRRTPVSRLHLVPRSGATAVLRRLEVRRSATLAAAAAARPRRGLPAIARPRPVTGHLRVGERDAAVASFDVETLLQQPRSFL